MVIRDRYLLRRSEQFYLEAGQEASVDLALEKAPPLPCTKLCGQVVSGCGAIPGATVKILDHDHRPLYHAETDSEGNFSIINTLMPGEYELIAVADGYLVSESRFLSLMPAVPLCITIPLHPDRNAGLGTVYGIIRDGLNAPLPGAQVFLFHRGNPAAVPAAVTVANADGEYLIYGVRPGEYLVSAFLYGYTLPASVPLDLGPEEIAGADLYLYRDASAEKGTIGGYIIYDGYAVPHAVTALYRIENNQELLVRIMMANGRGFYLFSGLTAGRYLVKAKLESDFITVSTGLI